MAERVKSTTLHVETAILLGRSGEHSRALQVLVHQERDPQAAEAYCCRAAQGHDAPPQTGPAAHPAPDLPELRGSRQLCGGSAERQPSGPLQRRRSSSSCPTPGLFSSCPSS